MGRSPKDTVEKPKVDEFVQGKCLGEGNFSRIIEATHKATGEKFALKVVEKQRIKRLRHRHQNIFNEINMEKHVLNRLDHPNIIKLYQTFQDERNLYFLLELLDGGELLGHLLHEGRQMGLDEDLARFYLADIVNAVDYMHANQVLHRDLKPENMVICNATGGHLKLIDFGTAKDLTNNKLDGPNFVGTPEYMPPETIENKNPTYASDMWAFGCIVYQLLTGETPFSGGSAYLTFLRVQDGSYYMPDYLSAEARDMINQLLQKNPSKRFGGTQANAMSAVKVCVPTDLNVIAHPFFKSIDFDNHMQATLPSSQFCGSEFFPLVKGLSDVEKCRNVSSEILDHSTKTLEDKVKALSSREKSILMHILRRKRLLHLPGIYPCFFSSASCGRCLYACNRGYVGFTYDLQNRWTSDFSFMQLSGPKLGRAAASAEADDQGGSTWETESRAFLKAINILNSLRPAFVVFCGDFVNSKPSQTFYEAQVTAFQKLVNQITPQVRLVFAAGSGEFHSCEEMLKYQKHFGDTRFSFWFGGIKYIVVNTTALCRESEFIDEVNAQTDWIKKELDDGKLCARGTMVISGHSLCPQSQDAHVSNKEHATAQVEVSQELRTKYWEMIHSGQVCAMISGSPTIDSVTTIMTRANEEEADEYQCELVSCKMPWSEFSNSIYRTEVTEAGTLTKRYNVQTSITTVYPNTPKGTAQASKSNTLAPEEENQETIVAAELVTVSIHSPDYRDSH